MGTMTEEGSSSVEWIGPCRKGGTRGEVVRLMETRKGNKVLENFTSSFLFLICK